MTTKAATSAKQTAASAKRTVERAKRTTTAKAPTGTPGRRPTPADREISERAYYIHLEEGQADPLHNWLRAERELKAA